MGAFDYVFTPNDIIRAIRLKHVVGFVAGVSLLVITQLFTSLGLDVSLLLAIISSAMIWRLDARIPFTIAIICFLLIILLTLFDSSLSNTQGSISENIAAFAFYMLVIGVALMIREHVVDKSQSFSVRPYRRTYRTLDPSIPRSINTRKIINNTEEVTTQNPVAKVVQNPHGNTIDIPRNVVASAKPNIQKKQLDKNGLYKGRLIQ